MTDTGSVFPDYDPGRDFVVHMHSVKRPVPAHKTFIYQPREGVDVAPGMEPLAMLGSATGAIFRYVGPQPHYVVFPEPDAPEQETLALASKFDDTLKSKHLQAKTVQRFGVTWVMHALGNIRSLAMLPGMPEADGLLAGRPAILVSPGPSLSQQLPLLAQVADRAVLIGGTHSLHALRSVGVTPDITIIADPGRHDRHLEDLPPEGLPCVCIAGTARPEMFEIPARSRFVFAGNGYSDAWMFEGTGEDWTLSTGGSVACSALSLAMRLGCDPIIMIGQDCAIGEDRYYAQEALDGDAKLTIEPSGAIRVGNATSMIMNLQQGVVLPGYYGGTVTATPALHAFWAWFEAICEREAGTHTIINATEGGACIRPAVQMPFASVASELGEPFDVSEILYSARAPSSRRGMLLRKIKAMAHAAPRTTHHARKCLGAMRQFFDAEGKPAKDQALERLKAAEQELKIHVDRFRLFALYDHTEVISQEEAARIAPDLAMRLHAAFRSFHFVRRAADFFGPALFEALRALQRG